MNFLDPFNTGNGGAAPSPAKQPSSMNYGGAAARARTQSGNSNPFGAFGQPQSQSSQQQQERKPAAAGLGNLSMLDPLAQQSGMAVRARDAKEQRRNKPIGRPLSMGEMPGVSRSVPAGGPSPVLDEFDPLSGGGGGGGGGRGQNGFGSSGNQASFDSGGFDTFTGQLAAQPRQQQIGMQQPTMNVSQAFGAVGQQQQLGVQQQQQQQQQQRQAQMAGLGRQVLNMGISSNQTGAAADPFAAGGGGDGAGFFDDDAFGTAGDDDFGQGGGFGDNDFGGTDGGGGFDLDAASAEVDAKEEKKRRKAEKKRKKEAAARAAQEQADREFAMKLHAEENARARAASGGGGGGGGGGSGGGDGGDSDSRLPHGWTRDHRGNIQGRLFERVTTKIIGHKWSPRSVMITANSINLRKVEADKRGQQRTIQITEYTTVGAAYINPEQAHAMIDVDGEFQN